jgi:hypothetical protein
VVSWGKARQASPSESLATYLDASDASKRVFYELWKMHAWR